MQSKPLSLFKKIPVQERSKLLVQSVLTAASQVLPREGFRSITTQKIAEAAGIGIGSLYDYFYSKEGIFKTLLDNEIDKNMAVFERELAASDQPSLESVVNHFVEHFFNYFYGQRKYMHNLLFALPRDMSAPAIMAARSVVSSRLVQKIRALLPQLPPEEVERRMLFVVNVFLEAVHTHYYIERCADVSTSTDDAKSNLKVMILSVLRR